MKPLISVIVPVYNCEKYLGKCVNSIVEQKYDNIEIILVNDGSTDNSGNICNDLKSRYSNIRVFHQDNKGQASARNVGIIHACGEYIGFVDSDDWINDKMYTILYNMLQQYNAQVACCGIERVQNNKHLSYFNENTNEICIFEKRDALKEIVQNKKITSSPCDKLYKSSIIKNNLMCEGMIFEDFEAIPRWINECEKIVYVGTPLYYYRIMDQSTMSTFTKKRFDEVRASKMRVAFYEKNAPELLDIVRQKDIEIGLNVLSYTRNAQECGKERKKLAISIRKSMREYSKKEMSRHYQLKGAMLIFGVPFFDFVNAIFSKVRRKYDSKG